MKSDGQFHYVPNTELELIHSKNVTVCIIVTGTSSCTLTQSTERSRTQKDGSYLDPDIGYARI